MNRYLALKKIVELGSFARAATALKVTPSAVSQMLSSLESELGLRLLNRGRHGAYLTIEGKKLYPHIEHMLYQYETMKDKTNEIKGLETGTVRIGAIASISTHWLPRLLHEFQTSFPKVDFVIHQGDYSSILEWIKNDAIDFGFVNPAAVSDVELLPLKQGKMLAILPINHPLSGYDIVPLKLMVHERFILCEEGHYYEPLEAFHKIGINPDIKYTIHDDYAIMAMVEAGLGVSILSELILYRTNYKICIRPTTPPISRMMSIAYNNKRDLPISSQRFIKLIIDNIHSLY